MDNQAASTAPWEREVLEKMVMASVTEQRRARRWRIFFRLAFLAIILMVVYAAFSDKVSSVAPLEPHTAVVTIEGVIEPQFTNAETINQGLRDAFAAETAQGVIIKLNSPGGSPAQAGEIFDEIMRLREIHEDKKVYAVIGDACASGCYYVAAAADEIYANEASLVGSIGVLYNGFGFVDTLEKIGAERRLLVAGDNKAFMDPFLPTDPDTVAFVQGLLDTIHTQFIAKVEAGRGDRLQTDNAEIFSGLAWTGQQSLALGLVDSLGSIDYVAREVIGAETLVDYTPSMNWLDLFSHRVGSHFALALQNSLYQNQLQ